jgi:hypothetical protein
MPEAHIVGDAISNQGIFSVHPLGSRGQAGQDTQPKRRDDFAAAL